MLMWPDPDYEQSRCVIQSKGHEKDVSLCLSWFSSSSPSSIMNGIWIESWINNHGYFFVIEFYSRNQCWQTMDIIKKWGNRNSRLHKKSVKQKIKCHKTMDDFKRCSAYFVCKRVFVWTPSKQTIKHINVYA